MLSYQHKAGIAKPASTGVAVQLTPDGAGNGAAQRLYAAGRIPDDELAAALQHQPDLSATVIDRFRFAGLKDMESSHPKSYAIVRDRIVAKFGAAKFGALYANDARIARLLAWNTAVADKLTEFQNYYRATKQEAAYRHISELVGEYEWEYSDLAGIYVESGEIGLQLREMLAMGQPDEAAALLVGEADAEQAEEGRLEQLAQQAEKWNGKLVAGKEHILWSDTDLHLKELLAPRHGELDKAKAIAWARMSGQMSAVIEISKRFYVFGLDHQYDRDDVFMVKEWEEARTEVVPVKSTPLGTTLITSDGYVLNARDGRYFGGTQARDPESHLAADEALLAKSGGDLGADDAVRLFRQMTLDLLLVNLGAAEQRIRGQQSKLYGGTPQPGMKPQKSAGAEIKAKAAALRRHMLKAITLEASTANRDLTDDERTEIQYTLEQIGRMQSESPLAAMMVVSNRDDDDTGPAEEDDVEDKTASQKPQDVASSAAKELSDRLENIDTVRRHFLSHPDAVLDLEPLHDQIIEGFTTYQQFWINLEIAGHTLGSLAKAVGMTVLQLGLVITGMFTAGLTSLAAGGVATALGVHGAAEAFESAQLMGAMSKLDVNGGFQMATRAQAASARRWAYISLGLALLDVGGFVGAARLAGRISGAAAMPDVAAMLSRGERDLAIIARKLDMPESTLVRQLETLTGTPREQLLARMRQVTTVKIGGFGVRNEVDWALNAAGEVRTLDDAVAIARREGVRIPDDIEFVAVPQGTLPKDAYASYGTLGAKPGKEKILWEQFYEDGRIRVLISRDILNSDEAIVAVMQHEMYELNSLRTIFANKGGQMTANDLYRRIAPGEGVNLHYQAWEAADALVRQMRRNARKAPPPTE